MKIQLNHSELQVLTSYLVGVIEFIRQSNRDKMAGTFERMQSDSQVELLENMKRGFHKKLIDQRAKYTISILLAEALLLKLYQDKLSLDDYSRNALLQITMNIDKQYINQAIQTYA